jgi:hypothetical protein
VRRAFAPAVAALLVASAVVAQTSDPTPTSPQIIRRGDRAALVILLGRTLTDVQNPRNTTRYRLVDVVKGLLLPLRPASELALAGCPRSSTETDGPETRVCVELDQPSGSKAMLDDGATYALYVDTLTFVSVGTAIDTIKPQAVIVPPVGGSVELGTGLALTQVRVNYSLDVSSRMDLDPEILVNGKPAAIRTKRALNYPLCYFPSSLYFLCDLKRPLEPGDKVSVRFVDRTTGVVLPMPGGIKPAMYTPVFGANLKTQDPLTDAKLFIRGAFQKDNTKAAGLRDVGVFQLRIQNIPWPVPPHHEGPFEGQGSPFFDMLLSTDATSASYVDPGYQYAGFFSTAGGLLQSVAFVLTPRYESDKKLTVANFMFLDFETRIGIANLVSRGLPGGGFMRILPRVGIELGRTVVGDTVTRPESSDPRRFKAGVGGVFEWGPMKPKTRLLSLLGFGGVRLDTDVRRYWIKPRPPNTESIVHRDIVTSNVTFKFSSNAGVALTWRNGTLPPLFKVSNGGEVGIVFAY